MVHDEWMAGMWWLWPLVLALVVALVWLVARSIRAGGRSSGGPDGEHLSRGPEQILEERFARGEVDAAELQRRCRELGGGR